MDTQVRSEWRIVTCNNAALPENEKANRETCRYEWQTVLGCMAQKFLKVSDLHIDGAILWLWLWSWVWDSVPLETACQVE